MKLVVLEQTFSPELSAPLTFDSWRQINQTLGGCLEARQVQWFNSLVSVNGDRSLCLLHAPYTETVREACRQARTSFPQVWTADLWVAKDPQSFSQGTSLIVAEINYNSPITLADYEAVKHQGKGCRDELNIQSAFSIIASNGTHAACVFSASSAEQVRSLCRKMGIPYERVWKASFIQPIMESVGSPHTTS
jgi:Protein of unknown function (DUF4242)